LPGCAWKDDPVVTAVISDLHLGTRTHGDLLARPDMRETLLADLGSVDHVVLLGDSIELRDRPLAEALEAAAPFFAALGDALAGRRVTLVPGNHDYQLAGPWLARRGAGGVADPLPLEVLSQPRRGDPLDRLARRMSGTELVLAYPGVWLRSDLYATHGHYLDCHNRVPTFECLARALVEKATGAPKDGYRTPDDYEAVLAPVYRSIFRIAQSRRVRHAARLGQAIVRLWEGRSGYRGHQQPARVGVRRTGVDAMAQVVERLRIDADYVLFGHLHHPGSWRAGDGTALVNTGSWVYEPEHLGPSSEDSSCWPGTCTIARDDGPPELRNLLRGLSRAELARAA
jgi:UDP-2,3-diacylglucosamine pyrophosphatase LpxH